MIVIPTKDFTHWAQGKSLCLRIWRDFFIDRAAAGANNSGTSVMHFDVGGGIWTRKGVSNGVIMANEGGIPENMQLRAGLPMRLLGAADTWNLRRL
jgi:hypothetical protein